MSRLQTLLAGFVTEASGSTLAGETAFEHAYSRTRIAVATDDASAHELAGYGWKIASHGLAPSFSILEALRLTHPDLKSLHPDQVAPILKPAGIAQLFEAQPIAHRGRLARWLINRSRAINDLELAKATREITSMLPMAADHPLGAELGKAIYLASRDAVTRITGSELGGYTALQVNTITGRSMLSNASVLDDIWVPNAEWNLAQWEAYEQLLLSVPSTEAKFTSSVDPATVLAASHTQHHWATEYGTSAYLGLAADALRRRFRHAPTSQWLDEASAETGIGLRSVEGMNLLIDLFMVEHLTDGEIEQFIVPAMRDADSDFAEMPAAELRAVWRNAFNPILCSAQSGQASTARLRVSGEPINGTDVETMRKLLCDYYGEGAIATLELSGKLTLVQAVADLPPFLRDEIELANHSSVAQGITANGVVFMIASNTPADAVCSTFLHEVGEHAALSTMLGRDYGRVVQRFNKLLGEGDTYALQASMQVPQSTAPQNLDSEHLAYLIQLAAADVEAREGGLAGYELGQRCIRDLRTWLYRTPLMRELESHGELDNFQLEAQDIAVLAREAVDFHANGGKSASTSGNQWDSRLSEGTVGALHRASTANRLNYLTKAAPDQQMAYLYSLAATSAPDIIETLEAMQEQIAAALSSDDEVTHRTASALSAMTLRLSSRARADRQLESEGFFAAISGTADPATSVLTLIRASEAGEWIAEHYQQGLGLTLKETFQTREAAVEILGQHHYPVQQSELSSVIERWGHAIAAEHRQHDTQAFARWFKGSVTRHGDGTPMVMYHGTANDFSTPNGLFWASAPTPAAVVDDAPVPEPVARPARDAFNEWFGQSKVADRAGKPITVFHGTNARFNAFQVSRYGAIGAGIYMTVNAGHAQEHGNTIMDLHVSLQNPVVGTFAQLRAMQQQNETAEQFTKRMMSLGHDGITTFDASGDLDYVVAFKPEQVKSASNNNGLYDSANPDIRMRADDVVLAPTETKAFRNWFGDSVVKDGAGNPLLSYHGTDRDFTTFKAGPSYFTSRLDYSYVSNSDVVMPVYLNIRNPYYPATQWEIENIRSQPERLEELKAQGYDGMIWAKPGDLMRGASGWGNDAPQFVTFYPNQIKSAIGNAGSFDSATDDIRFEAPVSSVPKVATTAFKQWFGASKLTNPDGSPMVLLHGTNADVMAFSTDSIQSRFPFSFGFHFTDRPREASIYADSIANAVNDFDPSRLFAEPPVEGGNVMPVYLRAENPLVIETTMLTASMEADLNREAIVAQLAEATAAGRPYDSVIIRKEGDEYSQGINVIVFEPHQIKSAIGNAGSFDRHSDDIRFKSTDRVPQNLTTGFSDWFVRSKVVDAHGEPLVVYHGSHSEFSVFEQQPGAHLGFHFGNAVSANIRLEDTADSTMDHTEFARLYEAANSLWLDVSAFDEALRRKEAQPSMESILADAQRQGKEVWEIIGDYAYQPTAEELATRRVLVDRYERANVVAHKYGQGAHIDAFYLALQRPLRLPDVGEWSNVEKIVAVLPWDSDASSLDDLAEEIREHGYDGVVYQNTVEISPGEPTDSFIAFDPEQIKSALANVGSFDSNSPDVRFSIADLIEVEELRITDQTELPTFQRWFSGSQVTEDSGKPLVVYHGTTASNITSFTPSDFFGSGMFGKGINFTSSVEDASTYASNDVFVNLDLTGKASVMSDALGIGYVEARSFLADNGGSVYPVFLDIKRPLTISEAPLRISQSVFMLAAVEVGLKDPDDIARFWKYFQLAPTGHAQLNVARHHRATPIFRQIATLTDRDGLIIHPESAPRGQGATHYLVLDASQVKSAVGNNGSFDRASDDIRFAFAGTGARTADRKALASAKSRIADGESAEDVRQVTGWFEGAEGKWRFELDDSVVTARESWGLLGQRQSASTYQLQQLIDHWPLFDAYPQLRYLKVTVDPRLPLDSAAYYPLDAAVSLFAESGDNLNRLTPEQISALLHEVQHSVQDIEKFASGGSSDNELLPSNESIYQALNADFGTRMNSIRESVEYAAFVKQAYDHVPAAERMKEGRNGLYDNAINIAHNAAYSELIEPIETQRVALFDQLRKLDGSLFNLQGRSLAYKLLAGEVEARNVQTRIRMTAGERRALSPLATQDAPEESIRVWDRDHLRLATEFRLGSGGDVAEAPSISGRVRFSYSPEFAASGIGALADFFCNDDTYQFDNYDQREAITARLVDQLLDNERFDGMVLPVGPGFAALTRSVKQEDAWQVTLLDAHFVPMSDEGNQSKRDALETFFGQFDRASAFAVISGTTGGIYLNEALANGLSSTLKGSTLADEYAEMRQDQASYSQMEADTNRAVVMPVYLNLRAPFDADRLTGSSLRVGALRDELVKQAEAAGRRLDVSKIGSLVKTIILGARNEESGPYYRAHDFWANPQSFFGGAGAAALTQLFQECGFDGIKLTERGHLTYGAFTPSQVKSAIGNTGMFTANPDIRFVFAGQKAANSDKSSLASAMDMAERSVAPQQIWKDTGWMTGADGDWRFEIDDSVARIKGFDHTLGIPEVTTTSPERYLDWVEESMARPRGVPLGQFFEHPKLFEAYPQLRNLAVKVVERSPGDPKLASFNFSATFANSVLALVEPYTLTGDDPSLVSLLQHELQHGVQFIEGFARGASVSYFEEQLSIAGDKKYSDALKKDMRQFIEVSELAQENKCTPEKFVSLAGYEPRVVERVTTWRQQGTWDGNIAAFRRGLMSPFALYQHEAGEVEARNTQARLSLTETQRSEQFPLDTLDVEPALVRASRARVRFVDSTADRPAIGRADSNFEWAHRSVEWAATLSHSATLMQSGETFNLYEVKSERAADAGMRELVAVALNGEVSGAFLFGVNEQGIISVSAMVHPDHRRTGIATAAYGAIEAHTGLEIRPSADVASDDAKAFWEAYGRLGAPTAPLGADVLTAWLGNSTTVNAQGRPRVFYHGTAAVFSNFDASRHRSILNNEYQGDGFHFATSPEVASSYADSARNQLFRQLDIFAAADVALLPKLAAFLKAYVTTGDRVWDNMGNAELSTLKEACFAGGFDIHDLMDIADNVEGSASARPRDGMSLFSSHHDADMPDHIKDIATAIGLGEAVPAPLVMPVYLRCLNTLYTDDREQARNAQANGFDSVCYSGPDIVNGDPEWVVFDPSNIRSAFEFDRSAKVILQQHPAPHMPANPMPIMPPTSSAFDRWIDQSSCINQFGEPRLVFAVGDAGASAEQFTDLGEAGIDSESRVTPAYLAIRNPFVVSDSATLSIADLGEKVDKRKAGMIVGDLLRDGELLIADILAHPRCVKWLEQAGYDGAIYRTRDGHNRYTVFGTGQALLAAPVPQSLNGQAHWAPVPAAPAQQFIGERIRSRQFTLSNQSRPHGHVVPLQAADQMLAGTDRLYSNHIAGTRLTAASIEAIMGDGAASKHLRDFVAHHRSALAGKDRIESILANHIRAVTGDIENARAQARQGGTHAGHHRQMADKLSRSLAWALEASNGVKSYQGLVGEDLLQWNKPLNEQSGHVRTVLGKLGIDGLYQVQSNGIPVVMTCNKYTAQEVAAEYPNPVIVEQDQRQATGRACYEDLANDLGGSRAAAEVLAGMGIAGAQQTSSEVLLFRPAFNHAPLAAMSFIRSDTAAGKHGVSLAGIAGVRFEGGVGAACRSIDGHQMRALEVAEATIRLLGARQGQGGEDGSGLKSQLANARDLQRALSFAATPASFIPWSAPLPLAQVQVLAPIIELDHEHSLPGSAVFHLIAGQQGSTQRAATALAKVGIIGAASETEAICWCEGVKRMWEVVGADRPKLPAEIAEIHVADRPHNMLRMG